jgi:hypothetical protein
MRRRRGNLAAAQRAWDNMEPPGYYDEPEPEPEDEDENTSTRLRKRDQIGAAGRGED